MASDSTVLGHGINDTDSPEGTPLQRLTSGLSGAVILVALVLVCYINTLQFEYIWDDDAYVTANPTLRSFGGLSRIWTELGATPQYYPMTFTTFWLEVQATQSLNPRISHGVNFLLHAGSTLILWQLLRRLKVPGAWAAAAIFGVHPIQVESVAWITERKNTLSMLFGLSAAFFYLRYAGLIEKPASAQKIAPKPKAGEESAGEGVQLSLPDDPRRLYILFFAFFVMALLSKTTMLALPPAIVAITWWKRGRVTKADLLPLIAPMIVALGLASVTSYLEHSPLYVGARGPEWAISPIERLMLAGQTTTFYLWKLFIPYPLIFNYEKWALNVKDPLQWLPLLGVIGISVLAFAVRNTLGRGLAAGWAILLMCLLPVMGFVNFLPMRFAWVADHFAYMASIAFAVLVCGGIAIFLVRKFGERTGETLGAVITGVAVIACVYLTVAHAAKFKDARTLWEATLQKGANPRSWMAAVNFASILVEKGKQDFNYGVAIADRERGLQERDKNFAAADLWLKRAMDLNPLSYEAEYLRARLALERRQFDQAVQHLLRADQLAAQLQKESFLQPQFLTAAVLAAQGKTDDAIATYRALQTKELHLAKRLPETFAQLRVQLADALMTKLSGPVKREMSQADRDILQDVLEQYTVAVEMAPHLVPTRLKLSRLLIDIGKPELALEQLQGALAVDKANTSAQFIASEVAMKLGNDEVAGAQLINLLKQEPGYMPAYIRLAEILDKVDRRAEAIDQLNAAKKVRPDFLPTYVSLAELLDKMGRRPEAIEELNTALKLRAEFPRAIRLKAQLEGTTTQPTTEPATTAPSADAQ